MKKAIAFMLMSAMLLTCLAVPSFANNSEPVNVYLDGNRIEFDVSPCIISNRTFVPLRAVLEAAGVAVSWDDSTRMTVASKGDTHVWFSVDTNSMTIQRGSVTYVAGFEVSPCIIEDRIFIPVKEISHWYRLR